MNHGKQHIDEELLIRHIAGETTDQEAVRIRDWINLSEANQQQFNKLQKLWIESADPAKVDVAEVNVDAAWKHLKNRIDQYKVLELKHKPKQRSLIYYASRIAAVFVLGVLIFWIYRYQSGQLDTIQLASADSKITNNPLPDGSIISLNQETIIEYAKDFSEKERRVKLSGEAFFNVEPDSVKPFVIEAQEAIITVLGTSFNGNNKVLELNLDVRLGI